MIRQILNALLVVSLLLAASAESVAALSSRAELAQTPSMFTPVADTYVISTSPTKNYGSRTTLKTDGSPLEYIYLKFNVQGVGAAPSAALRIYAETNNSMGLNIHTVSDTTWNETQITWNNAPQIGPIVASTGPIQAGNWYLVDVSSAVSGDGLVSFAITNPHTTGATLSSKEGSHPPELYIPIPVSTSPDPFVVRDGDEPRRCKLAKRAVEVGHPDLAARTRELILQQMDEPVLLFLRRHLGREVVLRDERDRAQYQRRRSGR